MASRLREFMAKARHRVTQDVIFNLYANASLVQEYSDDPDNPNVSAYLRSGLIERVLEVESWSRTATLDEVQAEIDGRTWDADDLERLTFIMEALRGK